LEGAEESQVTESKYKKVIAGDKEGQRPFKKTREKQLGKYCRDATVKMESERCVSAR